MDFLDRNFMSMGGQCVKKHETKCDKNVKFNWLITWSRIRVVGLFSHFFNESMYHNVSWIVVSIVETNFCVQLFEKFRFDLSNIALVDLIVRVLWINIDEIFLPLCGIIVSRSILEVRKFDLPGCNKRKGRKKKKIRLQERRRIGRNDSRSSKINVEWTTVRLVWSIDRPVVQLNSHQSAAEDTVWFRSIGYRI